jgi:hypothetical protein
MIKFRGVTICCTKKVSLRKKSKKKKKDQQEQLSESETSKVISAWRCVRGTRMLDWNARWNRGRKRREGCGRGRVV